MKLLLLAAAATALAAAAQQPSPSSQMQPGQMPMQPGRGMMMQGDASLRGGPAGTDYMMAMRQANMGMMQVRDSDPDRAFAKMMIAHHRGAIAMAEALRRHGKDAELQRVARQSQEDQRREIAALESWLRRHGGA